MFCRFFFDRISEVYATLLLSEKKIKELIMDQENTKKASPIIWVILHIMLAVMSLGSVCSKTASGEKFLSFRWCLFYGLLLFILGVYAIVWQQIIKRLPLTVAYANRAVSVIWGCIFGVIFFEEKITIGKIIGGLIVIAGVILYALSDDQGGQKPENTGKIEENEETGLNETQKEGM